MEQQQKPVVYIFYGDDGVAINESIAELKSRIGDASTTELNYVTLDGRSLAIEQLEMAADIWKNADPDFRPAQRARRSLTVMARLRLKQRIRPTWMP